MRSCQSPLFLKIWLKVQSPQQKGWGDGVHTAHYVCSRWKIRKSSFKMLGFTFSSKLDWASYIISIAKTASKKIEALIRSMEFLSPEVALYLYKSTIQPCMEYYYHVWACASCCYLELLDKLQKRIKNGYKNGLDKIQKRTFSPSLANSFEPLAHRWNVAILSLFYRYYFGRCLSELTQLVPLPYSRGRTTRYSGRVHVFSVTIPRWYNDTYVISFFPRTGFSAYRILFFDLWPKV